MKQRQRRGTGRLYERKASRFWWIQYYVSGKLFRESTKTDDRRKAEKFLDTRLAEANTGIFVAPQTEKVSINELAEDYLVDAANNKRKDIYHATLRWKTNLQPFFGHLRVQNISSALLKRYVQKRLGERVARATVNRELAMLKRMFSLAAEQDPPKVRHVPKFPKRLSEKDNVRKGFLEPDQYHLLATKCSAVGLWMRAVFEVGHTFGWRHSEIVNLKVGQIDLINRMIRLHPGETKNNEGRVVVMTHAVFELLRQCVAGKKPTQYVFTHEDGTPVLTFSKLWWRVCINAGLGHMVCRACKEVVGESTTKCECGSRNLKYIGLLFHDLRRTGVRNMIRRGIPEVVAMKISGHKTRSVFDRYNIVSESDLQEAARKMEPEPPKSENEHRTSTVARESGQIEESAEMNYPNDVKQLAT